jgi:hypothetical protein
MTEQLYLKDAYRKSAPGQVVGHTEEGGIILDQTIFYARGGGQPGDSGTLDWSGGRIAIATAVKGEGGAIVLVPAEPGGLAARGRDGRPAARLGPALRAYAHPHRASPSVGGDPAARHRRRGRRGEGAARLRHARGAAGPRGAGGSAERPGDAGSAGVADVDHRGRARCQSGPRQDALGPAAARRRAGAPRPDRRGRRHASTCNPAAAPMWRAPARSGSLASPRSRTRAARTGA